MNDIQFASILSLIVPEVINYIIKNGNTNEIDAAYDFYQSEVFALLEQEDLKLWHFSPLTLYNMYAQEKTFGSFDIPVEG